MPRPDRFPPDRALSSGLPRTLPPPHLRLSAAVSLLAAAACSDAVAPPLAEPSYAVAPQASQEVPTLVTFFGPERFTRGSQGPQTFVRAVSTAGYLPPFVLHVRNGDADGSGAVSSGSVTLDGVTLLPPSAFNKQGGTWSFQVTLGPTAQLTVSLASAPGSHLDVWIEGQPVPLFCPGGPAGSHATLEAAIAATPAGGTLRICDGTFNVDSVVVNKPITIRAQNPGGATLGDMDMPTPLQGGRPALAIDGVSAGTVRLVDLGFAMRGRAIIATGTYDRIEIDSARFYGRDSTTSIGVQAFPTTVPTAVVNVTNSRFEHMAIGVFPVANVEFNTRSSVFERFHHGAVTYSAFGAAPAGTQSSHGRIEDNVFRGCGQSGCIRALNFGRDLVVARNRFENPNGSNKLAAIYIVRGSWDRLPIVVEDNEIIGAATGGDPTHFAGWTVRTGIAVYDAPGVVNVVRRNHISDTYQGVLASSDLDARDNVVTGGYQAFQRIAPGTVTIRRNDFVGQLRAFQAPASGGDYRCNWWGSSSGPTSPPPNVAGSYAPWATQPIAGTTNPCDPAAPVTAMRVCASATVGGPMTVPTIPQAIALVADGGTVRLCEGTHHASNVQLGSKSLTIMAEGPGVPVVHGDDAPVTFNVWSNSPAAPHAVLVRGLRFEHATNSSISVGPHDGTLTVEQSEFHPLETRPYGSSEKGSASGISVTGATGSTVIRDNTFLGGDLNVEAYGATAGLLVEHNRFDGQTSGGTHIVASPGARIEGNDYANCGLAWCLFVQRSPDARIVGNRVTIPYARRTTNPIYVSGAGTAGGYTITDNVVTGVGSGGGNPWEDTMYPIRNAGIQVDGESATISRNRVTNAYGGINVTPVNHATGTDNVITHVNAPFLAGGSPGMSTVAFTRNDITDYVQATLWAGFASADLRCNWWGSASGPLHPEWLPPGVQVMPWATQPIEGKQGVTCTP